MPVSVLKLLITVRVVDPTIYSSILLGRKLINKFYPLYPLTTADSKPSHPKAKPIGPGRGRRIKAVTVEWRIFVSSLLVNTWS